jgi:hypothetical protein
VCDLCVETSNFKFEFLISTTSPHSLFDVTSTEITSFETFGEILYR